ncbi:VWA domain-containing protein [Pseudomonas sp. dw_358]|uniref:VWA domain-containing protein n=1 Tax=Pseudomonas sp. dw_358 TaxID=2720083 RepID=UPI001BD6C77C|nr:VWA domain-containing protein [Pseudomonas sp. dw_358]
MSLLWPHWYRPWFVLAVPLLGWLLWQLWHRKKRTGRWQMILPPAFHAMLLTGGSGRSSRLPWLLLGVAWALAVLALLGPSWQRVEQTAQKPADPLVILVQLTPEMLATDVPPDRLEQARRKILDLLHQRRDAQTAIVVYAGSAHVLVPLSDDLSTSTNLLAALKPSIMPLPGHRADLALRKALALLDQGALGQGRILWVGSQLDDQERAGIRQSLGNRSPRLLMLGIGSRDGAPVKQENGEFLQDNQGAILVAQLDSPSLGAFAADLSGEYRAARNDDMDLRELGLFDNPRSLRGNGQTLELDSWADQGYWLLLPLLLLAACAGRRGWLLCLPLLLIGAPQPSDAASFIDLWLRPDQQGRQMLEEQRPAEAARRFADPQWQGMALYEAGDYNGAALRFAQGNSAADHYNRGNALARAGQLEGALDAYDQALDRQPDLQPALQNKALVEQLLDEQRRQQLADAAREAEQQAATAPAGTSGSGEAGAPQESRPANQSGEQATASAQHSPTTPKPGDNPPPPPRTGQSPGRGADDDATMQAPQRPAAGTLDSEQRQALEQWLRQVPDDPSELLRRKFWYEQQQSQDTTR